ncbi:hypothetical protein F5884DRAFT_776548 [Xylogone sp. PMI_703]|nr:hypothetical protein F5884DRAFT_776548 [Xylogone sp. PMI_703]
MNAEYNPRDCSTWTQSTLRTILESLVCVGIVLSYIPQYIRIVSGGTFGISSWLVLLTTLFSTTQLASRLANAEAKYAFDCVNSGELRGLKAYSALLGFIQVITQWLCAVILVVIYLKHRNDSPPLSYDHPLPSTGITPRPISSAKLKVIVSTYSIIVLPISLAVLWRPNLVEDNFELDIWLTMLAAWFHGLFVLGTIPLVLLQYVPQILTTLSLHTRGTISIISLALQVGMFVILGVVQFLRIGVPTYGSPPHRHGVVQSYFDYAHISLPYIVTAIWQLVLLILCIIIDWGHFSGNDGFGSVKLAGTGEEQPLIPNIEG